MKTTDFSKVTIRGVEANAYIAMNAQGDLYSTVSTTTTPKRLIAVSILQKNREKRQAFLIHSPSQQILNFSLLVHESEQDLADQYSSVYHFESVSDIFKVVPSNESYWAAVFFLVAFSFWIINWMFFKTILNNRSLYAHTRDTVYFPLKVALMALKVFSIRLKEWQKSRHNMENFIWFSVYESNLNNWGLSHFQIYSDTSDWFSLLYSLGEIKMVIRPNKLCQPWPC